ncbi:MULTISPECIES: recombinase RecT [unclassified Sphingomonas]|uniref:recombinase RecT n=1 Tax=unclassified Sphingomonas TaxID=196159 RepID=UPI00070144F8|nr:MULTISPECIES: recombinase RecT [unclassified Sphingomonas]KQX18377.1 hypothetical protein ASD17_14545 [Sphingomonas sp. Root1294]KQY72298.1 hypothetical protein ASD39_20430 [Sphingomonas sp. Root50]KRB94431.1 hypothetical protein ASE22_00320 [Sphingomonas sp. Root720]
MNQLATRQQPGAVAPQRMPNEYDVLRRSLTNRTDDFKMALPAHITPEKFQRTIMTAAQSNPDLLKADRGSLITSCMKAAQDGLLPDGREAAIVTFNTRKKDPGGQWITVVQAQYMPMAFGLRKKILQSGEISSLETNVVYRREAEEGAFIFEAGTEAMLRHRPMLELSDEDLADENIVAAYSVATMKDGTKSFEVMRRSEINKVRQASQTGAVNKTTRDGKAIPPKGPWVDWFGEMARKTVMRRHSKTLPMSGDLIDVEATDESIAARSAAHVLSVQPDAPQLAGPTQQEIDAAEAGADPQTGELPTDEDDDQVQQGPADDQRGEAHTTVDAADDLIAEINSKELLADLDAFMRDTDLALLDDDQAARVEEAADRRSAALRKGK